MGRRREQDGRDGGLCAVHPSGTKGRILVDLADEEVGLGDGIDQLDVHRADLGAGLVVVGVGLATALEDVLLEETCQL